MLEKVQSKGRPTFKYKSKPPVGGSKWLSNDHWIIDSKRWIIQ